MLFNLFVNSISNYVSRANLLLYADDIKMFHKIKAPDDCSLLQDELNKFTDWVARLDLSLNLRKRQIVTFSRSQTPILNNYHINGAPLHRVFSIKDLGIHCSSSLCFSRHIGTTVGRALKDIGFIKRNTKHFSSATPNLTVSGHFTSAWFVLCSSMMLLFGTRTWPENS